MNQINKSLNQEMSKIKTYLEDVLHKELDIRNHMKTVLDVKTVHIHNLIYKSSQLNNKCLTHLSRLENEIKWLLNSDSNINSNREYEVLRLLKNSVYDIKMCMLNKERNTKELLLFIKDFCRGK